MRRSVGNFAPSPLTSPPPVSDAITSERYPRRKSTSLAGNDDVSPAASIAAARLRPVIATALDLVDAKMSGIASMSAAAGSVTAVPSTTMCFSSGTFS